MNVKTKNKLVSIWLVFALFLSVLTGLGGTSAKVSGSSIMSVYFDNSSYHWNDVYAYVYDDRGEYVTENYSWPGVQMLYDQDTQLYFISVSENLSNGYIIFSDGQKSTKNRFPGSQEQGLPLNGRSMVFREGYQWQEYVVSNELVNTSTLSSTSLKLGESLTVNASAKGGDGNYTYAVYYRRAFTSKWTAVQGFKPNSSITVQPLAAVDYELCVKVRDGSGEEVKDYYTFTVQSDSFINNSSVSANSLTLGDTLTVNGSAEGGSGSYLYAVYYKRAKSSTWSTVQPYHANSVVTVKPLAAVDYNVCIKVKDSNGTIVKKYFSLTVSKPDPLINQAKISAYSLTLGNSFTATAAAEGGSGSYLYAFYCKKSADTKWTETQPYSQSDTVVFTPSESVSYDVCVKVKDSRNTVSKQYFTVNVDKANENDIGGQALYDELFSLDSKVQISITMSQEEMEKLNQDYYTFKSINSKSPIYRKADLVISVGEHTYTVEEVGIRAKGNLSVVPVYSSSGQLNLSHYKLSFCETFDDEDDYGTDIKVWDSSKERKARKKRRFATLEELDVKWNRNYDNTHIRDLYSNEIFRENGILAQKTGLTQLTFNGENYGVMSVYEPIDDIFLARYLPQSALDGDLYKCSWTDSAPNYINGEVTYGVEKKAKGLKFNYNLKTNKKTSDHSSLANLLEVLASNPTKEQFESIIDTDYLADFLAASYFVGNPDDMRNNYNNHYIYFRKDTGKAIFIPYDNDRTLGVTYGYNPDRTGMTGQSPYSFLATGSRNQQVNPIILYAILNDNAYIQEQFDSSLEKVASSDLWNTSSFNQLYDKAAAHYEDVVTPSVSFANVRRTFQFSLSGTYTSGTSTNMSFDDFVSRIMTTYQNTKH